MLVIPTESVEVLHKLVTLPIYNSTRRMGAGASIKIANSTYDDVWVRVDSDRDYISQIHMQAEAEFKAAKASVKGSLSGTVNYEWTKQVAGYSRIPSGDSGYLSFDVPQGKNECWVTAFAANGNFFGGPKCFRATYNTYFNIVLCSDYVMRKGFKNTIWRCAEGSQQYWGPFVCPGCGVQKCKDPVTSGPSDGWCGRRGY